MAHALNHSAYSRLIERINRFPQGAPPSDLLYSILKMLFSEKEAELTALLPIRPFTVSTAAKIWKISEAEAQKILDELAERAILVDFLREDGYLYSLPPPMAGFFEFSMMRVRGDIDQKVLSELFHQYLNVEEEFIRALFVDGETQLGRIFVQEPALHETHSLHVMDYERATAVIREASHISVSLCYCRHKMEHLGKDCDAPKDICMSFNTVADSLIRHGNSKRIDVAECMDLLASAYEHNLVQFGENVQKDVSFICNCCGCCCEALLAIQKFGLMHPINSNYIAHIDTGHCNGCGRCIKVCPVKAISQVSGDSRDSGDSGDFGDSTDSGDSGGKRAVIDNSMCLGCGVCVRNCSAQAIIMEPRPQRVITPVDTVHRIVMMAIERGTLQHLIVENQVMASHRALAAVIGAILRLPPVKQLLANKQLQSRWLSNVIRRFA